MAGNDHGTAAASFSPAAGVDAAGIPWSPVHEIAGALADPHFLARGLFSRQPKGDGTWFVYQPVKFSRYGSGLRRGAPALGEHMRQVLGGTRRPAASSMAAARNTA